jgi:purine-binding chemotaxis protein CheW
MIATISAQRTSTDTYMGEEREYVTVFVAGQAFGVEVTAIQDVFKPHSVTPVPLARPEIAGVLNLRGRIVTAIDARIVLGLTRDPELLKTAMAIGVERDGEAFGLIVDRVGDVIKLANSALEPNPANLDANWRSKSKGVFRLDGQLLIALDLDRMLDLEPSAPEERAAA